jgi:hypothetical protein
LVENRPSSSKLCWLIERMVRRNNLYEVCVDKMTSNRFDLPVFQQVEERPSSRPQSSPPPSYFIKKIVLVTNFLILHSAVQY